MQFATPTEAEDAFYLAFAQRDLNAMMQVWLDASHVECIHPGSARLQGLAAIRDSWEQIFSAADQLHFQLVRHNCTQTANLAIHSISEQIKSEGSQPTFIAEVNTTNVYELTTEGWRMVLHHASPARAHEQTPAATMH